MMGVALVVYLERERVLQVVPGLLGCQAGHRGSPLVDADDLQSAAFWYGPGNFPQALGGWHRVRVGADFDLAQRADVAQLPDAVVAVIVRRAMRVRYGARRLPEERRGRTAGRNGSVALLNT
jgi:hypothetical protein